MKKLLLCIGYATALCALSAEAQAQQIRCDVNLSGRLALGRDGTVNVDVTGSGITIVCNLKADDRGMSKETCAGWYSTLLSIRATKTRARFYFDLSDPANAGVTSCTDLGAWNSRTPYFLELY